MPNSFRACCLTLFHVKTGQCCPPPSLEECSSLELNDEVPPPAPPLLKVCTIGGIILEYVVGGGGNSFRKVLKPFKSLPLSSYFYNKGWSF